MAGEQLEEIEIKEVLLREVADIETGELVLVILANGLRSLLAEGEVLHLLGKCNAGHHGGRHGSLVHHHHHLLLLRMDHLLLHHLRGDLSELLIGKHVGLRVRLVSLSVDRLLGGVVDWYGRANG